MRKGSPCSPLRWRDCIPTAHRGLSLPAPGTSRARVVAIALPHDRDARKQGEARYRGARPRWLMQSTPAGYWPVADFFPAAHGRLTPLNAVCAYFTGALFAEAPGAPGLIVQWGTACAAAFVAALYMRLRLANRNAQGRESLKGFARKRRNCWLDLHISVQCLLPAGMASTPQWLVAVPVVAAFRLLWNWPRVKNSLLAHATRRWFVALVAPLCGVGFACFGAQAVISAIARAPGQPVIGSIVGIPLSMAVTYFLYAAPALLLMREGWLEVRGLRDAPVVKQEEQVPMRRKIADGAAFALLGAAAAALSARLGNELPMVAVLVLQLARISPGKLIDVLITKGNERAPTPDTPLSLRLSDRQAWIDKWLRQRRGEE